MSGTNGLAISVPSEAETRLARRKPMFDPLEGVEGVRLAMAADEDDVFALLTMLHAEIGVFSLNAHKVRLGIRYATQRMGGIIFVNKGPQVVASLGLVIAQDWYTDDEYLAERWNFVHPDHRRSDWARRLIEQAKWASHCMKLPLHIGIHSFDRTEAKVRLFARHVPCVGAYFMYGDVPHKITSAKLKQEEEVIKAFNQKARTKRSREVVPVVETILKLGRDNVH